jgi:CBS domain containing-hemolysin-like protein
VRRCAGIALWILAWLPGASRASFLSGDTLDAAADVIALIVLVVVPIALVVGFWLVHILPEKVAERKHHPQKDAIKALCLLSLVFGGLLWPLAWIWAYSKPVVYKLAYGREKHDDYYKELIEEDKTEALVLKDDVIRLRRELELLRARGGGLPEELADIREQLAAVEARLPVEPPILSQAVAK